MLCTGETDVCLTDPSESGGRTGIDPTHPGHGLPTTGKGGFDYVLPFSRSDSKDDAWRYVAGDRVVGSQETSHPAPHSFSIVSWAKRVLDTRPSIVMDRAR